ncbi:MAG: hypothetical protein JXA92_02690 [candidate division Zixibacteria bacterium]|nr:hypothetical protein [candidate division Zixibacteria bacterium]
MNFGEERKKVRVEQTEFLENTTLNQPFADIKVLKGTGHCLIVTISTRGEKLPTDRFRTLMFEYDEYLTQKIYIQLPTALEAQKISLSGNSFIHLLGRYDQPPETKIFVPQSGSLVIDSLVKNTLYGTIDGRYENSEKLAVAVDGKFKVKMNR